MNQAKEDGKRIPEDISVIGYDNLPINSIMEPTITTIDQHLDLIAARGVEVLIDYIEDQKSTEKDNFIKPTLSVGKTVIGGPHENT